MLPSGGRPRRQLGAILDSTARSPARRVDPVRPRVRESQAHSHDASGCIFAGVRTPRRHLIIPARNVLLNTSRSRRPFRNRDEGATGSPPFSLRARSCSIDDNGQLGFPVRSRLRVRHQLAHEMRNVGPDRAVGNRRRDRAIARTPTSRFRSCSKTRRPVGSVAPMRRTFSDSDVSVIRGP